MKYNELLITNYDFDDAVTDYIHNNLKKNKYWYVEFPEDLVNTLKNLKMVTVDQIPINERLNTNSIVTTATDIRNAGFKYSQATNYCVSDIIDLSNLIEIKTDTKTYYIMEEGFAVPFLKNEIPETNSNIISSKEFHELKLKNPFSIDLVKELIHVFNNFSTYSNEYTVALRKLSLTNWTGNLIFLPFIMDSNLVRVDKKLYFESFLNYHRLYKNMDLKNSRFNTSKLTNISNEFEKEPLTKDQILFLEEYYQESALAELRNTFTNYQLTVPDLTLTTTLKEGISLEDNLKPEGEEIEEGIEY